MGIFNIGVFSVGVVIMLGGFYGYSLVRGRNLITLFNKAELTDGELWLFAILATAPLFWVYSLPLYLVFGGLFKLVGFISKLGVKTYKNKQK